MFKSLLRIVPTMCGNVKINCYVDSFIQHEKNKDVYTGFVKNGDLTPLQNNLLNKKINISFINGKWEYDIAKYYKYYSESFYNKNYSFNKLDFQLFDKFSINNIMSRNKDYEFGCKRTSFAQTGFQFNFFAPIWCDNFESLPDIFRITISFYNGNTKTINIPIKTYYDENYLRNYLKKYLDKIDSNVIFANQVNNQATYYGINVKNGGIINIIDNIFSRLYNIQMTQNNFDYTICEGFKRNNIILKQILPLSFSFNIEDFLTEYEKTIYSNKPITIKGAYVKSNCPLKFYDFNVDYFDYRFPYRKYDKKAKEFIMYNSNNTCEQSFPSLEEKRFIGYKYSNKLCPVYNRWKLKLSDDNYPYIINMSYAFNKEGSKIYGDYPLFTDFVKLDNYNLGNVVISYKDDEYCEVMDNNVSTWYSLYYDNFLMSSFYNDVWGSVDNNKIFYKGVLYDFNNIKNTFEFKDIKIDKFAVFVKPKLLNINNTNVVLYNPKYIISSNNTYSNVNINTFNDVNVCYPLYNLHDNSNNAFLEENYIIYHDNNYYNGYETYINYKNYLSHNKYYLINDVSEEIINYISNMQNYKNTLIVGYYKLPIGNNCNMFALPKKSDKKRFIFSDANIDIYYSNNIINKSKIMNDNALFFSDNAYENISNESKISLFTKCEFISEYDLIKCINDIKNTHDVDNIEIDKFVNSIKSLDEYCYVPTYNIDNVKITNYFDKILNNFDELNYSSIEDDKYKDNYLWISLYKINNSYINNANIIRKHFYAQFLDKDNIKEYFAKINVKTDYNDIINNIYFRQRIVYEKNNKYIFKDVYKKLSELVKFENVYDLYNAISDKRNENGYFDITYDKKYNNVNVKDNTEKVKTIELDLYYYDIFYMLNSDIIDKYLSNTYDYQLYLYSLNNNIYDNYDNIIYCNTDNDFSIWYDINNNNKDLLNIGLSLKPLFESMYLSETDNYNISKIFSKDTSYMYITPINIQNSVYYKYLNDNIVFVDFNIGSKYGLLPECLSKTYLKNLDFEYINNFINNVINKNMFTNDHNNDLLTSYNLYINNINILNDEEKNSLKDSIINGIYNILISYPASKFELIIRKEWFNMHKDELITEDGTSLIYNSRKNIEVNLIEDENNMNDNLYNSFGINYCSHDNINYMYYIIEVVYDNTSLSFNINNKTYSIINTINNESIDTYSYNNQYNYNYKNFYKIQPYLKENIFSVFSSLSKNIIKPYNYNINLYYFPKLIDNGNTNNSYKYENIFYKTSETNKSVYNIEYNTELNKQLKLNRYINDISPLITEVSNNILKNVFELKYKISINSFNENNIYINDEMNIYKYNGIKIYNNIYDDKYDVFKEFEYKHFNDNKIYNLEKEINITFNELFTYNNLLEMQNKDIVLKHFKKYLLKYNYFYEFNDDEILFLYNRYKLNIISNSEKLNKAKTEKLYTLVYKFTLY